MNETIFNPTFEYNSKTNNKIIVCIPVVTGNGSKYTAMNLAHYHKVSNPDHKVALVDLDFHLPSIFAQETSFDQIHNIDNLLDKIDGNQLNSKLFHENMIELPNQVDLLKGTALINNHPAIQRHHIETIFRYLKEEYDYTFVSVSNIDDNSGTVYGLHEADEVVMVAVNNYVNYLQIEDKLQLVRRYFHKHLEQKLIFNRYNEKSQVDFGDWIRENNIVVIGSILYDEKTMDGMDLSGTFLSRLNIKKNTKIPLNYESILNFLK